MFIDGYLALATAFPTPGTITEFSSASYARQPISFSVPKNGTTRNTNPFSFGFGLQTIAGRAIFSSATGAEMLLALPFATPYSYGSMPGGLDAGQLCLQFTDLLRDPTSAAGLLNYLPGAVLGVCWNDPRDFVSMSPALSPAGVTILGGPQRMFATGQMVAGTPLVIKRGLLSAAEMA